MRALADTSIFIAREAERPPAGAVPEELLVSVVTVGELALGVMLAADSGRRSRRLATLTFLRTHFEPLPVDEAAADAWAGLVGLLRAEGRRAPVNDAWIAATAIARGLPIVTQDDDYDGMPGLEVVRV